MLRHSIFVVFINVLILAQSYSPALAAKSYIDSTVWGRWETKPEDNPSVVIDIKRHKRTEVTINGKPVKMDYAVTVGEHNNLLLEFSFAEKLKNQTEVEKLIYLIRGKLESTFVITGFFDDIVYDTEGVEKQFDIYPITLYLKKKYGSKD